MLLSLRKIYAFLTFLVLSGFSYAQSGTVVINQDDRITELLELKKELNSDIINGNGYTIQVYAGNNRHAAESAKSTFDLNYSQWPSVLLYENPEFKVWGGRHQTRLQADKALRDIKKEFPDAFILSPKKK